MTDLQLTDRSGGAVAETAAEKPGIFISYARSDSSALAEELVAGLELAGFRPFLDRQDIAVAEDWEARLGALILGADTVVFILSPAAVRSERCAWEVERAAELGKRLIPVQGAPVLEAAVPERLRRLNYIFFREGQSFARPLRELAAALRQDVEWIREHTRLSEAATRWRARDRGTGAANDLLLRGDELADAKAWLARRKENAPEITALLTSFLTASEERAAALANQERERLAERERLVAERERAQHNVRRVQRRWFAILSGLAHVDAMLIGLDALPDQTSKGIRQRVLRPVMSAVNALDGAWRDWSSGWSERTVLRGHTDTVKAVAFSPDGERVLTGSADGTARLWTVFKPPQNLIDTVRTSVPRCLTPAQREVFHLGTPPPRWCYERNLWPFADHGQPYTEGGDPPYGPPAPTLDERLLAAWDRIGSWFGGAAAKQGSR